MKHDVMASLDDQDAQSSRALSVLNYWQQQGYDEAAIIVRALNTLGEGKSSADQTSALVASVKDILRQMRDLLGEMRNMGVVGPASTDERRVAAALDEDTSPQETVELSQQFLSAVKKAARPGIRLDG